MIQSKNYKRPTRKLSDRQKQLISQKLKGRKKSSQHAKRISMGMKNMWNRKRQAYSDSTNQTEWL